MNCKRLLFFLLLCLSTSLFAQTLTVTKHFAAVPNSSVLALYKNQFGHKEKPDLDETFPYALIRVHLQGNEHEVTMAKSKLSLYLGQLLAVEEVYKGIENELLFLIPMAARHVEITCGEGCAKQTILDEARLRPNTVYYGEVRYVPAESPTPAASTPAQAPKRQFFKFRVTPDNAVVTIDNNGATEILPMREGGIASKMLNFGTYGYSISADKYHTEQGNFTVSASQTEMYINLRPKFGWLSLQGDNTSQGAYVFATNMATGGMLQLGTIPLSNKELDSGTYTLRVQKEKYKEFSTTITILDGQTTHLRPTLVPNFAQVTLATLAGADIYVDGNQLATGRWTGTLELGEHSVEIRKASHRSAFTTVNITPQSAGQTIQLNHPTPIYGSLIVDGTPADAAVYLDGKKVGTSPLYLAELLMGVYKVRLEKDGYQTEEKTVEITENHESMLDFTLTKSVAQAPAVQEPVVQSTKVPRWVRHHPKAENDTYYYVVETATATTVEAAHNKALGKLIRHAIVVLGLPYARSVVDNAIANGNLVDLVSSLGIPVNEVCTSPHLLENGEVQVYVLCQVAVARNIRVAFTEFDKCGDQNSTY